MPKRDPQKHAATEAQSETGEPVKQRSLAIADKSKLPLAHHRDHRGTIDVLRDDIEREHLACHEMAAAAVLHAIEAGKALNAAKVLVPRGEFGRWLDENFAPTSGLTERTAQRYMLLASPKSIEALLATARRAQANGDPTRVSDLPDDELLKTYSVNRALRTIATNDGVPTSESTPVAGKPRVIRHNDWLTPAEIVAAAARFLGTIDLDPCAADGHSNIPANCRYTTNDDGLATGRPWKGTAFINPGQHGEITPWIDRACQSHAEGTLTRAVLLLPGITDAVWSAQLAAFSCGFVRRRPVVECSRGDPPQPALLPYPALIVAVASSETHADFAAAFAEIANVFLPYLER